MKAFFLWFLIKAHVPTMILCFRSFFFLSFFSLYQCKKPTNIFIFYFFPFLPPDHNYRLNLLRMDCRFQKREFSIEKKTRIWWINRLSSIWKWTHQFWDQFDWGNFCIFIFQSSVFIVNGANTCKMNVRRNINGGWWTVTLVPQKTTQFPLQEQIFIRILTDVIR